MRTVRVVLIAAGAVVIAYGGWLMVRGQSARQLVEVIEWAAAAVVIHDGLLAPLSFGVGWVLQHRLPGRAAAPAAIASILVGTVSVAGFAVLTRSHDGGSNTTLLDRDYPVGIALVVLAVLGGVILGIVGGMAFGRLRRAHGWRG